jgi:general secretion pathway protein F
MRYQARVVESGSGRVASLSVEAASEAEARSRLVGEGAVVLALKRDEGGRRVTAQSVDIGWWCRELRTLLTSGMTAVEAIETMAASAQGEARAELHKDLLASLRQGQALSRAMRGCGVFPPVLVASVTASERTSKLVDALDDYLRYHDLLERLRRQVVSAAIYPALVVALGLAISLFLLGFVIPRFSRIYVDMPGQMSGMTEAVLWLSRLLQQNLPWFFAGVAGLAAAAAMAWRAGTFHRIAQAAADGIPWLERQWRHFRLARLFHALALMFRGGYPLDEALAVCAGLELGDGLRSGIQSARQAIAQGKSVSAAFAAGQLTDAVTERLLAVGERSGSFDVVLQTIADRHAGDFGTFVERATRIVEPLLLLLVALLVGSLVVMMYMPIFDMAGQIGGGG